MINKDIKLDLEAEWTLANINSCCSCHNNPPCSFCTDGYSLPMDEFVELELEARFGVGRVDWYDDRQDVVDDYDRAMKGIGI